MFRNITFAGVLLALLSIVLATVARLSVGSLEESLSHALNQAQLYSAGGLAVIILALVSLSWRETQCRAAAVLSVWALFLLIGARFYIGLAVLPRLPLPVVVSTHVLLGFFSLWLMFWLALRVNKKLTRLSNPRSNGFNRVVMLAVIINSILGLWVTNNHAGLACPDFPQCNGLWLPDADYASAFDVSMMNLLPAGQIAALFLHRAMSVVCFALLSITLFKSTVLNLPKPIKTAGLWVGILLFAEIFLGILGVKLALPLWVAVAHSVVGALLLLPLLTIGIYNRYGFVDAVKPTVKAADVAPVKAEPKSDAPYEEPSSESLYLRLKSQLKRTRSDLSGMFASLPLGSNAVTEELLEEVEANLLMADIGIDATSMIINRLTQRLDKHQLKDGDALLLALKQELLDILKPCDVPLEIPKLGKQGKTFVILVVGVNGAGKTTTIGKLANRLKAQGLSVMLAAGDTFRAAAVEQLQVWGERNQIHVVAQHTGADSASVIFDALQSAQAKGIDVLIADTAGRLQNKTHLMEELRKVKRIMSKLDDTAPHEALLVLDAGIGQNALSQAKLFNEAVTLSGLVLTKLDGTAKGGIIFALAKHAGLPIRYIGVGEGIEDLQDFNAENFIDALFVKD